MLWLRQARLRRETQVGSRLENNALLFADALAVLLLFRQIAKWCLVLLVIGQIVAGYIVFLGLKTTIAKKIKREREMNRIYVVWFLAQRIGTKGMKSCLQLNY